MVLLTFQRPADTADTANDDLAVAEQALPRRLAGSIAFGDGQTVVAAPVVADGPRCYQVSVHALALIHSKLGILS